jgi:hypothetical protein
MAHGGQSVMNHLPQRRPNSRVRTQDKAWGKIKRTVARPGRARTVKRKGRKC